MSKKITWKPVHYNEMSKDMIVYIKRRNGSTDYIDFDENFHTISGRFPENIKHMYQLTDGFKDDKDGMIAYMKQFKRWTTEMFAESKMKYGTGLLYTAGYSHTHSVMSIFKQLTKSNLYDFIEHPNSIESEYIEKNNNGGLQFAVGNITCESYSYDFKNHFATCLTDKAFYISANCGKEITLDKMPSYDELYMGYGYLHVKITCSDPDIKKLISFSPHNIYTDIVIMFVYELKTKNKMSIKMELVQDGKPNCYKYDQEDLIQTRDIFLNHYIKLSELKTKHPTNKLFKRSLSSIWGTLTQKNHLTRTEEQCIEQGLDYDFYDAEFLIKDIKYNADGTEYFELINSQKPYLHNLARIKAYLSAFSRIKTARIALKKLKKVLRIHTDSITFSEPFKYESITGLLPEFKTSGLICWENVNTYHKIE